MTLLQAIRARLLVLKKLASKIHPARSYNDRMVVTHPFIWRTRVFEFVWYGAMGYAAAYALGMLLPNDVSKLPSVAQQENYYFFLLLVAMTAIVYWGWFLYAHPLRDNRPKIVFLTLFAYFICILIVMTIPAGMYHSYSPRIAPLIANEKLRTAKTVLQKYNFGACATYDSPNITSTDPLDDFVKHSRFLTITAAKLDFECKCKFEEHICIAAVFSNGTRARSSYIRDAINAIEQAKRHEKEGLGTTSGWQALFSIKRSMVALLLAVLTLSLTYRRTTPISVNTIVSKLNLNWLRPNIVKPKWLQMWDHNLLTNRPDQWVAQVHMTIIYSTVATLIFAILGVVALQQYLGTFLSDDLNALLFFLFFMIGIGVSFISARFQARFEPDFRTNVHIARYAGALFVAYLPTMVLVLIFSESVTEYGVDQWFFDGKNNILSVIGNFLIPILIFFSIGVYSVTTFVVVKIFYDLRFAAVLFTSLTAMFFFFLTFVFDNETYELFWTLFIFICSCFIFLIAVLLGTHKVKFVQISAAIAIANTPFFAFYFAATIYIYLPLLPGSISPDSSELSSAARAIVILLPAILFRWGLLPAYQVLRSRYYHPRKVWLP